MNAKPSHPSICVLVSGGPESCAMLAHFAARRHTVHPLYIRQNLIWERADLGALRRFLRAARLPGVRPLVVLAIPADDLALRHWSVSGRHVPAADSADEAVYLPGRNLLLLSKAAVFCATRRIPAIAIGSLDHNPFADATPRFFRGFARVASEALAVPIRVVAPFRRLTKAQVIRRARRLPLQLSFSCIAPARGRHCGRCNKCAERQRAFREAGLEDRTVYA